MDNFFLINEHIFFKSNVRVHIYNVSYINILLQKKLFEKWILKIFLEFWDIDWK